MSGQSPQTASFETLADWLGWLETLSPTEINLGLDRVSRVLDRLQPQRPGLVLHVAGTNGKGSTVEMLRQFLMAGGLRVGAYTSPHLCRYNERIRIDDRYATDEEILAAFARVEACREGIPLTYFEYGTLAAIAVFEACEVNAEVLEIGLGGRLDAVNAIEPDGGIITNISLDHADWLGSDLEGIAAEKAGIMRGGKPFVFGARQALRAIDDKASACGAELLRAGRDFDWAIDADGSWHWSGRRLQLSGLRRPALAGAFQAQNAAGVLALLEALNYDAVLAVDTVNRVMARLTVPGRFQAVERECQWIVDVAHNPGSAEALAEALSENPAQGRTVCVVGVLADKDPAGIIGPLLGHVDQWIAVTPKSPRAREAKSLGNFIAALANQPVRIAGTIEEGLQIAEQAATPADRVLVCGSFYTVGPALDWLAIYSPASMASAGKN